jgi:hypothetical protein
MKPELPSLYMECSMPEASIQEFFTEGNMVPLTLVYEDFVQQYEKTMGAFLDYPDLDHHAIQISPP